MCELSTLLTELGAAEWGSSVMRQYILLAIRTFLEMRSKPRLASDIILTLSFQRLKNTQTPWTWDKNRQAVRNSQMSIETKSSERNIAIYCGELLDLRIGYST